MTLFQSLTYLIFPSVDLDSVFILITNVLLALLNILCRFSFVKIHPRTTSNGSRKAFPKAARATHFPCATVPSRLVVFRFITFFPSDCPVFDSKYVQYRKNTKLDIR